MQFFRRRNFFVDGNTTKCPSLQSLLWVGERGTYFTRFNVEAMSIRAVADCGEVQLALSERSFSDFWPPQLGEKRFQRQNHVPQHRLRP